MPYSTRTKALWDAHRIAKGELDRSLQAQCVAEFPPGTRVRWIHGYSAGHIPLWRRGCVVRVETGCRVLVQTPAGNQFRRFGHMLELD